MLKRFKSDKRGASEIVGTALFLVILLFFFTNVFLWHDQVTREMDHVIGDRMNSGIRVTAFPDGTGLTVDNVGGLDVTLSRVWILTEDYHWFADFDELNVHVKAGKSIDIALSGFTVHDDLEGSVRVSGGGSVVHYDPPFGESVVFRVLTKRANSAACELVLD